MPQLLSSTLMLTSAGRRRWIAALMTATLVLGAVTLIPTAANADAPVAVADDYSVAQNQAFSADWWDSSWSHRVPIALDNSGQSEDLTDFPVLVTIDGTVIDYDDTADGAEDLRFIDGDGTLLAHEVAQWDESGTSLVWVRVPKLGAGSDGEFVWLYYGNPAAPSAERSTSVWSNHYRTVYHLDEEGTEFAEATGTAWSGANVGTTRADGQVGGARAFHGSSSIRLPDDQPYLNGAAQATVSAWVKPQSVTGDRSAFGVSIDGNDGASRINIHIDDGALAGFIRSADLDNGEPGGRDLVTLATPITTGAWQHIAIVVDFAADTATGYVNGVAYPMTGATSGFVDFLNDATPNTNSDKAVIGANEDGAGEFFKGRIDEVRLADIGRSAEWIRAQYLSMTGAMAEVGDPEEMEGVVGVTDNDVDADDDHLVSSLVTPPSHAESFEFNADGTFSYDPEPYFVGSDEFTYLVSDGSSASEPVAVHLEVYQTNDWPTLSVEGDTTIAEGTPLALSVVGDDPDDDGLTYSVSEAPEGLSVEPATGAVDWTPAEAQGPGSITFDLTVTDDGTPTMWATVPVTIEVTETNQAPSVVITTPAITAEGDSLHVVASASDPDLPANQLSWSASGLPAGLSLDADSGVISGELGFDASAASPYLVEVTATDDGIPAASDSATLLLVVENTNRAPEAADGAVEIAAGSSIDILLVADDPDGESLDYSVTSAPAVGKLTGSGPVVTYSVGPTSETRDQIRFLVDDGDLESEVALIDVAIDPNLAPIAGDDAFDVDQGRSLSAPAGALLGNDADPDGDGITVRLLSGPRHGVLDLGGDGGFTYEHDGRSAATDSFTYVADDGVFASESATVTFEIVPNTLPQSQPDSARIQEDTKATIEVLANDHDPDGDAISVASVAGPSNGRAYVVDRTVVFRPDHDWHGTTEFEYVVNDDRGGNTIGRISVEVVPVNDPPHALDRTTHLKPDRSIEFSLAPLVSDPDDTSLVFAVVAPDRGELVALGPAAYRYVPEDGFTGVIEVPYTVTDASGLGDEGVYVLVIEGVTAQAIAAPALVGPSDPTGDEVGVLALTLAGVEVPGLALMFGAVFETVESLRLPLLILLVTFIASVLLGLPGHRRRDRSADA